MAEKIQYTKDEVREMMLTLDFVAIPIDTTKLKEYTRPVETTVFGIPIKLELINFNNKFEYQYMNDDIILQIYDKASGFIDTQTDLEPFQDLFFFIISTLTSLYVMSSSCSKNFIYCVYYKKILFVYNYQH